MGHPKCETCDHHAEINGLSPCDIFYCRIGRPSKEGWPIIRGHDWCDEHSTVTKSQIVIEKINVIATLKVLLDMAKPALRKIGEEGAKALNATEES